MPHEIVKLWLESRAGEDEGRGLSAPRKIWNPRRKSAVAGALLVRSAFLAHDGGFNLRSVFAHRIFLLS